jgi:hypothetical protein
VKQREQEVRAPRRLTVPLGTTDRWSRHRVTPPWCLASVRRRPTIGEHLAFNAPRAACGRRPRHAIGALCDADQVSGRDTSAVRRNGGPILYNAPIQECRGAPAAGGKAVRAGLRRQRVTNERDRRCSRSWRRMRSD